MDRSDTKRVVVGVTRSLGAYQALRYAVAQARERGANLVVVRAFNVGSPQDVNWRETIAAAATEELQAVFAEACGGLPTDLSIQIVACEGGAGPVLVSIANRDPDLLIIGGSGAHRLTRAWSGKIARYCARHATCPVVIVPPPSMAREGRAGRLARAATRDVEDFLGAPSPSGTGPKPSI